MKKCSKCNKTYDDSWKICLDCRTKLDEIRENGTEISQILSIFVVPLPNFFKKVLKDKAGYEDTLIDRLLKKDLSVKFKLEWHKNGFCRAKIWPHEKGQLKDYDEIEDANDNFYNPLTYYQINFVNLYSEEEKTRIGENAFLEESLDFSYLFRTNEIILHLNGGRFSTINSLITREIPLKSILFRLDVADLKNLEKYHVKSFFPAEIDYYAPNKYHRKYQDLRDRNFISWVIDVFNFEANAFPPIIGGGSDAKEEKSIAKEKMSKYALKEMEDITKLSKDQKYVEAYARIIRLENILDENGIDKKSLLSLKAVLAMIYVGVLFNIGSEHVSNKNLVAAAIAHLDVKDFILKNIDLLGLSYDTLVNFMAKVETDLKNKKDFSDVKKIREKYRLETKKIFGEEGGFVANCLIDASITQVLSEYMTKL